MNILSVPAPPPVPSSAPVMPGSAAAWAMALRPRSMAIAVSPVLVAVALVWSRGDLVDPLLALLALAAAVMMQVITNLQNDVGYTARGAERLRNRMGLPRATALGVLTPAQVRSAILLAIAMAVALGLPLVAARGWPVLAMGLASIVAALAYMGGPRPIAWTPLGEPTVFVFFGLVAVVGTDFVLSGRADSAVTWLAAAALGGLAAAALVVNNARDIEHDRSVGRRTLPSLLGRRRTELLFGLTLAGPFVLLPLMAVPGGALPLLLPLLLLPSALRLWRDFVHCAPGLPFNGLLFRTFLMELKFAALLAAGALLARLLG